MTHSDSDSGWLDDLGRALAIILPFLYTVGFVAVNFHTSRYGALSPSYLSPRFISAAVLFVALTAAPFWLGCLAALDEFKISPDMNLKEVCWQVTKAQGALLLAALFTPGLVLAVNAGSRIPRNYDTYLSAFFIGWLAAKNGRYRYPILRELLLKRTRGALDTFGRHIVVQETLFGAIQIVLLAGAYGAILYPSLSPAYGGGAAWWASIRVGAESPFSPAVTGAIVDRSDTELLLVSCATSTDSTLRGLSITVGTIQAISFERMVVLSLHRDPPTCEGKQ